MNNVIILGSGPAGYTAGIYLARAGLNPIIITGKDVGGQLIQTSSIENWPGASSYPSGFELMDSIEKHVRQFNVNIINDTIDKIEIENKFFKLHGSSVYESKSIIVATGSSARYLNIPSENKFINNGISACATCDGFFYRKKDVAVIGGGNTAISDALYLSNICNKVHLIHRRDTFRSEKILTDKIFEQVKNEKIILHLNSTVDEFIGNNFLETLKIKNIKNNTTENISINGVFIAIGRTPNSSFLPSSVELRNGYIVTGNNPTRKTETSVAGIYAAGDVADEHYQQAITSAGTGCMAALDVKNYLQSI